MGGNLARAGWVTGRLYDIGEYPGLRVDEGAGRVAGEIFEVSVETLGRLDELEGFDPERVATSLYVRRRVDVAAGSGGGAVECWTYEVAEWHCAGCRRIPSGDWLLDRVARS